MPWDSNPRSHQSSGRRPTLLNHTATGISWEWTTAFHAWLAKLQLSPQHVAHWSIFCGAWISAYTRISLYSPLSFQKAVLTRSSTVQESFSVTALLSIKETCNKFAESQPCYPETVLVTKMWATALLSTRVLVIKLLLYSPTVSGEC